MSRYLAELDALLALASEELQALQEDRLDDVELYFTQRSDLMDQILPEAIGVAADDSEVKKRLLLFADLHEQLREETLRQREDIRTQLIASRQQSKRLQAYHKTVSYALQ